MSKDYIGYNLFPLSYQPGIGRERVQFSLSFHYSEKSTFVLQLIYCIFVGELNIIPYQLKLFSNYDHI